MAEDVALESQDFEALLKDLTALVDRLERGNLPLEESIATYEKGAALLARAQQVLDAAQARLERLIGPDQTAPIDPEQFLEGK
ncbi:MAG TPA: exodeoxyribonuclease VII small subunit [Myxococcota bacterium]|jgi:exodeoxyribonuclease VII small subunit|nr:exodeoxyribonuclease VII small subunit [Myxococcota bacterium]